MRVMSFDIRDQELTLANNDFTRFPIELSSLQNLRLLDLSNNSIALLPRNISTMTQLQRLDLSR